jgi:hypothetical protein
LTRRDNGERLYMSASRRSNGLRCYYIPHVPALRGTLPVELTLPRRHSQLPYSLYRYLVHIPCTRLTVASVCLLHTAPDQVCQTRDRVVESDGFWKAGHGALARGGYTNEKSVMPKKSNVCSYVVEFLDLRKIERHDSLPVMHWNCITSGGFESSCRCGLIGLMWLRATWMGTQHVAWR